jgi:hypothetical protein
MSLIPTHWGKYDSSESKRSASREEDQPGVLSREAKIPINLVRCMVNDPKYMPNSSTLYKAARFLKVHMEDLLYDDEKEGSSPN